MLSPTLTRKFERIIDKNVDKIIARKRHFTFIVKRNKIICYGYNRIFHSHTLSDQYDYRFADIHSELASILKFPHPIKRLKDYDFVNVRIRRDNGLFGLARPCIKCIEMLSNFGVSQIYYTNELGSFSNERIF